MIMEDEKIIDLFFARDEKAIEETALKYGKYCNTVAGNIIASVEDINECINDVYLKVWNSIPPHRPKMLKNYLGKITRNVAFDTYRKMKAKKRGGDNAKIEYILNELEEFIPGGIEPEDELIKAELIKTINEFLQTLSAEKCGIFIWRYWYAESIEQIANKYGRSVNYISVSLNRLRKQLKECLIEKELIDE